MSPNRRYTHNGSYNNYKYREQEPSADLWCGSNPAKVLLKFEGSAKHRRAHSPNCSASCRCIRLDDCSPGKAEYSETFSADSFTAHRGLKGIGFHIGKRTQFRKHSFVNSRNVCRIWTRKFTTITSRLAITVTLASCSSVFSLYEKLYYWPR